MSHLDLSICIVNWCTADLLTQCVQSIIAQTFHIQYEIIIVDNASADDSFHNVWHLFAADSRFVFLPQPQNLGFAAGNNLAFKQANGRYIALLNPDTLILPHALDEMVKFLDAHPECGLMAPRLLNGDGSLQPSLNSYPSLRTALWQTIPLRHLLPHGKPIDYRQEQTDHQPSGACLILRREVLDIVGGFDERFFMYYEEVDLCKRIRLAGWQIRYIPQIAIIHFGGQSSIKNLDVRIVENFRSKLLYFEKHYGHHPIYIAAVKFILWVDIWIRTLAIPLRKLTHPHQPFPAAELWQRHRRAAQLVFHKNTPR